MTNYINLDTMQYPFHDGDVELDKKANWAVVQETEVPTTTKYQILEEKNPKNVNGVWERVWYVKEMTDSEKVMVDTKYPSDEKIYFWNH